MFPGSDRPQCTVLVRQWRAGDHNGIHLVVEECIEIGGSGAGTGLCERRCGSGIPVIPDSDPNAIDSLQSVRKVTPVRAAPDDTDID
jgi:hypothetical protein